MTQFYEANRPLLTMSLVTRKAKLQELVLAHDKHYLKFLFEQLNKCTSLTSLDSDTFFSPSSADACLLASGAVLEGKETRLFN